MMYLSNYQHEYVFGGFVLAQPDGERILPDSWNNLRFPVNAYRKVCADLRLVFPLDQSTPPKGFGALRLSGKKIDSEPPQTVAKPQPTIQPKDSGGQEIAPAIELEDVKGIFNKNHPRYSPTLDALCRVWVSFNHDPLPEGISAAEEIRLRIKDFKTDDEGRPCLSQNEANAMALICNWTRDRYAQLRNSQVRQRKKK